MQQMLDDTMIVMTLHFPIFAELLARIGIECVNDPNRKVVAWTDGSKVTINEATINHFNLNPTVTTEKGKKINRTVGSKELCFILCHELMHLIGLTFDRADNVGVIMQPTLDSKEKVKQTLWNIATDYEINSMLFHNKLTDDLGKEVAAPVGRMPSWVCYDEKYKDLHAEEIYKDLMKEQNKNNNNNNEDDDNENDGDGNGSGGGQGKFTFDNDGNLNGDGEAGEGYDLDDHLPVLDDTTRNEIITKMDEVFGSRTNGLGSSAIDRVASRVFQKQPFNWVRALSKYIRGWVKANYTWSKPSRAGIANGIILPSSGRSPKMHIGVAVDTSGSITQLELDTMLKHVFTILSQFKDFTVDVWCCGSKVYEETWMRFTRNNMKELVNFQIKSDGGNDMRENFPFIKKKYSAEKLDAFICLSDFYDPLDKDTETVSICPCIWLVLDHDDFTPPSKIRAETYRITVDQLNK